MSRTSIENLSDEYFYEIFDYLDVYELYEAFSNLNHRFQQLLDSSSLLIKIKYELRSDESTINFCKQIILQNKHRILSLYLPLIACAAEFSPSFTFDSSFVRLESIIVEPTVPKTLTPILENLACLPRLFSLTINTWKAFEHLNDIYRLIFALPMLKYNKFIVCLKDSSITLPVATDQQFGPIESLIIDHCCTLNELVSLISYTPQLRHLTVYKTDKNEPNVQIFSLIHLSNLNRFFWDMYQISFNELKIFLTKISSNLKILSINCSNDTTFLDAHRCERLILHYYPQLEKFYLTYYDRMDNDK